MEAVILEQGVKVAGSSLQPETDTRLLLPHFPLRLDNKQSTLRDSVEQFISQRFKAVYGAELSHFLPYLLSTHTDSQVCAALGFQPATQYAPLFLEHYLDCPVETALSLSTNTVIQREAIVEIGNLASGRQRATQTLFVLIADILQRCGYEWVVFTANRSVRAWVEKLNLRSISLGPADPALLPDKGASWGSYYDDQPVVLACHIEPGFEEMKRNRLIDFLRQSYHSKIVEFSEALKQP